MTTKGNSDGKMMDCTQVSVGRVNLHASTYANAVNMVLRSATLPAPLAVRLTNAWCVVLADDSPEYAAILNGPGLTLPDGRPIATIMRRRHPDLDIERVRGPSFFRSVLDLGRDQGLRHFFLGGTPEVLAALVGRAKHDYPGIEVAGYWAPPFGPIDEEFVAVSRRRVEEVNADIVWIGLGTPKQDFLSARLAPLTQRPCIGVGAAFDFLAGTVREAPSWVQALGLEWLYRLSHEPRRLWRRYLVGNARFIAIILRS